MKTMKKWRNMLGILIMTVCMMIPGKDVCAAPITNAADLPASGARYDFTVPAKNSVFYRITTDGARGYYSITMYNSGSNGMDVNLYEGPGTDYSKKVDEYVYSGSNETYTLWLAPNTSYYLEVYSYSGTRGGAALNKIPDDFGNYHSEATPIAFGQMVEGAIEVSDKKESDFFCFSTDNSNSYYEITAYGIGTKGVDCRVYYGPDESYEHFDIYAGSGSTGSQVRMLEKNHTYYIRMMGSWDDATRYKLSVKKIADDASNDFKGAKRIKDAKAKSGKIEIDDDVDYYKFITAKDKTAYQLTMRNTSQSSIRVTLYTRNDIASAHSAVNNYYISSASSETIWLNLSKKHTYYIKVSGGENATYSINMKNSVNAIKKAKPGAFKVKNYYSDHPCIYWKLTGQYAGYEIWRSTHKGYGYKKIKTISKAGGSGNYHYDDYTCKKRTTYYYKVRYYVRNNGKVVGGKFTKPLSYRRRY